ncbi:AAA-type ATPase lid domain-containing protein [Virgibacillus salexigens]|uniref:hypothetical protein n=1 Tax=Virgibacillus kapii TaxID=1638645 RepID=UPI00403B2A4E
MIFYTRFNNLYNLENFITKDSFDLLVDYDWPGNVRQLESIMERLVVTSDRFIQIDDIPNLIIQNSKQNSKSTDSGTLDAAVEDVKKSMIRNSYDKHKSSR